MTVLFRRIARLILTWLVLQAQLIAAPDDTEKSAKHVEPVLRRFDINDATLESNVFTPYGNAATTRKKLDIKLQLQLSELERLCKLTEAQRQKLIVAASVDIKRFFDDVESLRLECRDINNNQEKWQGVWGKINQLQTRLSAGLFNEASFFAKTLQNSLTESQQHEYDALTQQRKGLRYRACIEHTLIHLETTVALRYSQRDAITKIMCQETNPPEVFGHHDQSYVLYQMSSLSEQKFKQLLDERQWNRLKLQLEPARRLEKFLIKEGIIAKEEKLVPKRERQAQSRPQFLPADATRPDNGRSE